MKIGNYTADEILEFMTEGEGRGFLGRSMFDAMYFEIERLKNGCKELEQQIDDLYKLETTLTNENERLNNIIKELEEEYINYMDKQDFAKKCKISRPYLEKLLKVMNRIEIYEFCKQRNKIKELKGSDKE